MLLKNLEPINTRIMERVLERDCIELTLLTLILSRDRCSELLSFRVSWSLHLTQNYLVEPILRGVNNN